MSFSPDASRFLAQSQSRLLPDQADPQSANPLARPLSQASTRGYDQRQGHSSPYNPQTSRFPFASRLASQPKPAPLFFSANNDDFREEDDNAEHEREVADFYAIQRSRRDFGAAHTHDSSGSDDEGGRRPRAGLARITRPADRPKGIRSSWTGDDFGARRRERDRASQLVPMRRLSESGASEAHSKTRDRLVDVDLASTIHEDDDVPAEIDLEQIESEVDEDRMPDSSIRLMRAQDRTLSDSIPNDFARYRPPSPDAESILPGEEMQSSLTPRHDPFWSALFLICIASVFSTFLLVCLHTAEPSNGNLLGDTIYTTLRSSFYLLAVDTVVAIAVALLWLAMLRSFVKPLVILVMIAVPIISLSFSLYPFISSYKGSWNGTSTQDKVMRWLAVLPGFLAIVWTYTAFTSRNALGRAIELLEFSTRILAARPSLILVGFGTLAAVVLWTWTWTLMFTRVFLGGHLSRSTNVFVIDSSTWCLGVFFVLLYLWTLGLVSGIQRATTAATVSQWYFYRLVTPSPSSIRVVRASFDHAITTLLGTICLSTLLTLAIRLPLLVLPRRISGLVAMCCYYLVPTSVTVLTNPLTLTYAAIHSQPLATSAKGLANMSFIAATSPTTTLTPGAAAASARPPAAYSSAAPSLYAYRLAKLILHATRFVTAIGFGFAGWVSTARMLAIGGSGVRGSLYAYVVGLIAGAIGWAVLGAVEGILGGVLDAVVVCWGSEMGRIREGEGDEGYCQEAEMLLRD